jgi:ankyrin repeat protein
MLIHFLPAHTTMAALAASILAWSVQPIGAQVPPSPAEVSAYSGLHRAAHAGDLAAIATLIKGNADLGARDGNGRTPLHVAAFASHEAAVAALAKAGADVNALDGDKYDMVTIAAVANDLDMLKAALAAGNRADLTTSIYDGTALIAAAHLGHADVVKILIDAGAPLDHVNNLGWTALIKAVVLGDGRSAHQQTVRHLVAAGANREIADRQGKRPLDLAKQRGYQEIVAMLEK